jgi:hypothetical protein
MDTVLPNVSKFDKIKSWLTLPTILVSAIVAVGTIISIFGFSVESPESKLKEHIVKSAELHAQQQRQIDSTAAESEHIKHVEGLLESLLRGECLENPRENLARQGLLVKCKELGIDR